MIADRFAEHGAHRKAPRRAIPFRTDTPFAKITRKVIRASGVEERFRVSMASRFGVHPDTKQPYRWAHGDLLTVLRAELPLISAEDPQALKLVPVEHGYWHKPPRPSPRRGPGARI
jgi:hypothetical protein